MNPNRNRLVSRLEALVIDDMKDFQAESRRWEQKYHSAMAANKRLDEQNEGLRGEVSKWKSEVHSLNALNATISEKLQELKERCASQYQDFLRQEQSSLNWQASYCAMRKLKDSLGKELDVVKVKYEEAYKVGNRWFEESKELTFSCEKLKTELQELKKEKETRLRTIQTLKRNYLSVTDELDQVRKELAEDNAEKLRLHCLLRNRTEELAAAEERHEELDKDLKLCAENCNYVIKENNYLRGEVEQLEKKHEDLKKKSHEILATMEENLQKKQEQIEALTVWKTGAESVLDTLEEELKNAIAAGKAHEKTIELLVTQKQELSENLHTLKQINSFQEHRIEVLARKANKMRKKEQND